MIRGIFSKRNRKRTWKIFLVLVILAFLLGGSLQVRGKNVFYCAYDRDVVAASHNYIRKGTEYTYTDRDDSWIMLWNYYATEYIVIKFTEEAAENVPVHVSEYAEDGTVLAERDVVWEKGESFLEFYVSGEETNQIKLHIPVNFTVDRSMHAAHYQRYKKSLIFFVGILAVVVLLTVFFSGTSIGLTVVAWMKQGRKRLREIFVRERMQKCRLEWIAFLLILIIGGLYAFLEPPVAGMCYDDQDHYLNSIRNGHVYSSTISQSDYDVMYQAVSRKISITTGSYKWEERAKYSRYLNALDRRGYIMFLAKNRTSIAALPYVPYSVLHLMLKTLHVPWTIRFMLGRWLYVWFLALCTALGMKRLKSGKLVAFLLALTPGIIFLSANYGYDTWITAFYMYGFCCVFGELQTPERRIGLNTSVRLFAALVLAGIPKPVYFPMHAIAFFMPRCKFKSKRGYWLYKLTAVACVAFPVLLTWLRTFAGGVGSGDARGGSEVNAALQVQYALQDPGGFAHVILEYLKGYLNPFGFGKGWANNLAYMGNLNIGGLVFVFILLGALVSLARKEPGKFPWWYKLGLLLEYFVIGAIVCISMYVVFTPVRLDTVLGAQQRYLTPVLFPVIYGITRFSGGKVLTGRRFQIAGHAILIAAMTALNCYAVWIFCLARY